MSERPPIAMPRAVCTCGRPTCRANALNMALDLTEDTTPEERVELLAGMKIAVTLLAEMAGETRDEFGVSMAREWGATRCARAKYGPPVDAPASSAPTTPDRSLS